MTNRLKATSNPSVRVHTRRCSLTVLPGRRECTGSIPFGTPPLAFHGIPAGYRSVNQSMIDSAASFSYVVNHAGVTSSSHAVCAMVMRTHLPFGEIRKDVDQYPNHA